MTDRLFEALRDRHRRQLLVELLDCDRKEAVSLPNAISEKEADTERVYVQLAHNHLPKLEEMEYIQWDRENDEIARDTAFETIEPSLELLVTHADKLPEDLV